MQGTTIVAVRKNGVCAVAGDGQVTMGQSTVLKHRAVKVRRVYHGKVVIGCYSRRSHEIVDTQSCLLQTNIATRCVDVIRQYLEEVVLPAYPAEDQWPVRHIVIRTMHDDSTMVALVSREELPAPRTLIRSLRLNCPEVESILLNLNTTPGNVILGDKTIPLYGPEFVTEVLAQHSFKVSLHTFLQVNHYGAELLYNNVFKYLKLKSHEVVADLYCGMGAMTLPAARKCAKVYGVECVPQAIDNAKENAAINGITNVEFILGDAEDAFPAILEKEGRLDAVIVDPPRKGLAPQVVSALGKCGASRIVYVSCDPATLARDIAELSKLGYTPLVAQPVDLFPHTTHVETVTLITRAE